MQTEKSTIEATEKDWLLRFKTMLKTLHLDYEDVAEITGNTEGSIKNFTVKGIPRNMRFAIEIFEKMNDSKIFEIDGKNDGELISIKNMKDLRVGNSAIRGRDFYESIGITDIVIVR